MRVGDSGSRIDPEASRPGRRWCVKFLKARWITVLPAGVCDATAVRRHLRPPVSLSSPRTRAMRVRCSTQGAPDLESRSLVQA